MPPKISVIIPALNEEDNIERCVASASTCPQSECEVIVADGGSQDSTVRRARRAGAQVVSSPPGRARQMNAGARRAKGDILMFLHADSQLPDRYQDLVASAMQQAKQRRQRPAAWGAFESIAIDGAAAAAALLRAGVALRSRLLGRPYGDQAIFVRRTLFWDRLGGYKEMPLLEDLDLVQRLGRTAGPPVLLPVPLATSGRRWQALGLLRTTLVNQAILAGYALGVDVATLAAWYHRR